MKRIPISLVLIVNLLSVTYSASSLGQEAAVESHSHTPEQCYTARDLACLKSLKPSNPFAGDEKTKQLNAAYYYEGLLIFEQGGDKASAKDSVVIAISFGNDEVKKKAKLVLNEWYEKGLVELDSVECTNIGSQKCLYDLADNKNDANAQAYIGSSLVKNDPELAIEYLQKAANQGHESSHCLLLIGVKDGTLNTGQTYHDAVDQMMKDCRLTPAFKRFSADYHKKYLKKSKHKAYAHSESGRAYFRADYISADLAARAALESCNLTNKKKELPCKIIKINDKWVSDAAPAAFPTGQMGAEALITYKARESFAGKYTKDTNTNKVFVHSDSGAWSWKTSSEDSLAKLTKKALSQCQSQRINMKGKYQCRVIDYVGE